MRFNSEADVANRFSTTVDLEKDKTQVLHKMKEKYYDSFVGMLDQPRASQTGC